MAQTPQWLAARLAWRGLEVLERHKEREPVIGVFAQTLGVSAPVFLDLYARVEALEATRIEGMADRTEAMGTLGRKIRGWTAVLASDLRGFDRSRYGDKEIAEDLVQDGEEIFRVLKEHAASGRELPFYAEQLEQDLRIAMDAVRREIKGVGATAAEKTALLADVRKAAESFQVHLVAFRRTLRAHLGSAHPDYQRLRVGKNSQLLVAEETDEVADLEPGDDDDASDPTSESAAES